MALGKITASRCAHKGYSEEKAVKPFRALAKEEGMGTVARTGNYPARPGIPAQDEELTRRFRAAKLAIETPEEAYERRPKVIQRTNEIFVCRR